MIFFIFCFNKTKKKYPSNLTTNLNRINGKRKNILNGWIRVEIYGNAEERGFAHGYLLAQEIKSLRDDFDFIVSDLFDKQISTKKYIYDCTTNITPNIIKYFPEFYEI